MKLPALILGCLVAGATLAVTSKHEMWAWKDENGVTHYSDRPVPGARRVEIATMTPESVPSPAADVSTAPTTATLPTTVEYTLLEIWTPEQDQSFFGTDAQVPVRVRSEPEVAPGHQLQVYLDGKLGEGPGGSLERQFANLERGAHSLVAVIVDERGKELIRSQPRVFYIQQPSVNPALNVGPKLRPPKPTPRTGATAPKAPPGA